MHPSPHTTSPHGPRSLATLQALSVLPSLCFLIKCTTFSARCCTNLFAQASCCYITLLPLQSAASHWQDMSMVTSTSVFLVWSSSRGDLSLFISLFPSIASLLIIPLISLNFHLSWCSLFFFLFLCLFLLLDVCPCLPSQSFTFHM